MAQEALHAIVADAHPLCRSGMASLLAGFGYGRITFVDDFEHLRRALSANRSTRLASISVDLAGLDASLGLRRLRLEWPELRIVALSEVADRELVLEVISAGVFGFIPKTYEEQEIRLAMEAVIQGRIYVPNVVSDLRSTPISVRADGNGSTAKVDLTERQCEVLRLLAAGKSNKEIARALKISEGTVKVHVNASFRALGVHNRVSAAAAISDRSFQREKKEPFIPGLILGARRLDHPVAMEHPDLHLPGAA